MRKNNKQFVRNIIIISVLGLSVLMIALFVALQTFLEKQYAQTYIARQIEEAQAEVVVELSENKMILVSQITEERIVGYDIKAKRPFNKNILDTAKINDAYGKALPISQIQKGDLIEVGYQQEKDSVIAVSKSTQVQSFKRISGITVDKGSRRINIAGTNYEYTEAVMLINAKGEEVDINKIGPFDIVTVHMYQDTIWTVIVEEAGATLSMVDLPTQKGQIEIDNSRLIQFVDITEPIKLIPGTHKLVIKMEGYETITDTLIIGSGEALEISLVNAEVAYTLVKPYLSTKIKDYTIKIGDTSYKPNEEIKLPQGEYLIEITSEGYEKWSQKVKLASEEYKLSVNLITIETEPETEETVETDNVPEEAGRTIVLNTDPIGAKVYIDGAYKGETPYTITLPNGSYNILFEKANYMIYSANILLDHSNDQSSFLYVLTLSE